MPKKRPLYRGTIREQAGAARSGKRVAYSKSTYKATQLMISGTIFVLLVGVKLLLPERLAQMREPITAALERNMDVREVFSAVNRGFSGGNGDFEDTWEELYEAVFGPAETAAGERVSVVRRDLLTDMRAFADGAESVYGWVVPDKRGTAEEEAENILYPGREYPANTEPEQVLLGFDYAAPVEGVLSSGFGFRENPVDEGDGFHYGVDLGADAGAPIAAFADGEVTVTGDSSGYGKYLILTHKDGYTTLYAHCSEIIAKDGDAVKLGDRIASVGETGQTTGPHLHFELCHNGIYLNPIYYVG